jgi:hypothetical protein
MNPSTRDLLHPWVVFAFVLPLTSCGVPALDAASDSFESKSGKLVAQLSHTDFHRGENQVQLCFTEHSTGTPVDELELEMVPHMPSMGHGSSGVSAPQELGGGCYDFEGVILSMPGTWELRTSIRGPIEDSVSPTLYLR